MVEDLKADEAIADSMAIVVQSAAIVVVDDAGYSDAGLFLREVRTQIKALTDLRLEITRPIDKMKADWMARFAKPIDKLKAADETVTTAMRNYNAAKEAKRFAEEKRLRDIQEAEIKKAEAAAAKAEAKGNDKKADELKAKAQILAAAPVVVEAPTVKVEGVATVKRWKARIVDANKVPRQFCEPVQSLLDKHARENNDRMPVDGVEFYCVEDFSAKSTQEFKAKF